MPEVAKSHELAHMSTVKPVLSGHSKIEETKVLKTSGSLVQVKSIAECSSGAFCYTFYLHQAIIGLEKIFLGLFLWPLKTGFSVSVTPLNKKTSLSVKTAVT